MHVYICISHRNCVEMTRFVWEKMGPGRRYFKILVDANFYNIDAPCGKPWPWEVRENEIHVSFNARLFLQLHWPYGSLSQEKTQLSLCFEIYYVEHWFPYLSIFRVFDHTGLVFFCTLSPSVEVERCMFRDKKSTGGVLLNIWASETGHDGTQPAFVSFLCSVAVWHYCVPVISTG